MSQEEGQYEAMMARLRTEMKMRNAIQQDDVATVRTMLDEGEITLDGADGGPDGFNVLHHAVGAGKAAVVQMLLEYGGKDKAAAPLNKVAVNGSPLHMAAISGFADVAKLLLEAGADPNHRDRLMQVTPLFHCTGRNTQGTIEVARLLIEHGVDVNATNVVQRSVLHIDVRGPPPNEDVYKLILASGANTNLPDRNGDTPLHLAASSGNAVTVRLLLEHGADPSLVNAEGKTAWQCAHDNAKGFNDSMALIDEYRSKST